MTDPAEPMINFSVHQARAGAAGAPEDFEQMLALLVQATSGEANLVFANPGDWGIDVLVGDLHGQVSIWQAKYFIRGVGESQRRQIEHSLRSALNAASADGHRIARWVLCIPSSMDAPTTRWWHRWRTERQRDVPRIELWDETELRRLLLQPAAAHVRRHYYNPYRQDRASEESTPGVRPLPAPEEESAWRPGAEHRLGGAVHLLHEGTTEQSAPDRSWTWRETTADRIEPDIGRVRLRQLHVHRPMPAAEQRRAALRAQAALLARLGGRCGLPRLLDVVERAESITLVTSLPPGRPWTEVFGPGPIPVDRLTTADVLTAAVDLCTGLRALHERGHSHRAISPEGIMVDRQRCYLRDVGLAAVPAGPGEGDGRYRAPEQHRRPYAVDGRTDVYQLAAVVYHTVTGHPPAGNLTPPVRATLADFPEPLDQALRRALDEDPERRPATIQALADALRSGRRELSQPRPDQPWPDLHPGRAG
ncbi:serine/threonine protein kinase [Plantactinospora sp. B24E8]|uniref:protein kinase domain-containing protein n=1 Tax=Plantactinospora sp. B24E8 TaxID=3153567 RepID=UPI00325EE219